MGRGLKGATTKTSSTKIGAVLVLQSIATDGSVRSSTAQHGHSSPQEASFSFHYRLHHDEGSPIEVKHTSHVHAQPSLGAIWSIVGFLRWNPRRSMTQTRALIGLQRGSRWPTVLFWKVTGNKCLGRVATCCNASKGYQGHSLELLTSQMAPL